MSYKYHPHVISDQTRVTKRINKNEYQILQYIMKHGLDITPKIFNLSKNEVIMEKYDCNILDHDFDQTDAESISHQINHLIDLMHHHDIFHGDINEENIVLNLRTMTVKIIDFDRSKRISSLTQKDIDGYNEAFSIEPPCQTIAQILEHELHNVSICY